MTAPKPGKAVKEEMAQIRIDHVLGVLVQRVEEVLSGKRARVFTEWASKQGDLKVLSTHGVDEVDLSVTNTTSSSTSKPNRRRNRAFPEDPLDLDLVPVEEIPSQFPGKPQHLIDSKSANHLELFFRSIKLAINFAPVSTTAWLALFSSTFRSRIWYRWVTACLAASGPAFIKWGELQLGLLLPTRKSVDC